jgi:hypothetical protein
MTRILAALVLVFFFSVPALADVVELKTGQRVEGTLRQADQATVSVEVGGQVVTFKAEQVKTISYGAASASTSQSAPASEALRALKALQSATSVGITYRYYAPRVIDTKVQVDRFLLGNAIGPERAHMLAAMGYYELAAQAWSYASTEPLGGFVGVGQRVEAERATCPSLQSLVDQGVSRAARMRSTTEEDRLRSIGIVTGSSGLTIVWACAAAELAEAEKLLAEKK